GDRFALDIHNSTANWNIGRRLHIDDYRLHDFSGHQFRGLRTGPARGFNNQVERHSLVVFSQRMLELASLRGAHYGPLRISFPPEPNPGPNNRLAILGSE